MKDGRIAVPSNDQGGLDGTRAGHFGHCDVFTLIDVKDGEIDQVTTINNREHMQGGCMVPVNLLAENKVKRPYSRRNRHEAAYGVSPGGNRCIS